jgi:hypothetical protein
MVHIIYELVVAKILLKMKCAALLKRLKTTELDYQFIFYYIR